MYHSSGGSPPSQVPQPTLEVRLGNLSSQHEDQTSFLEEQLDQKELLPHFPALQSHWTFQWAVLNPLRSSLVYSSWQNNFLKSAGKEMMRESNKSSQGLWEDPISHEDLVRKVKYLPMNIEQMRPCMAFF